MSQLIATLLSVMLLLIVPLGLVQVHTVMSAKSELLDLSLAATKFISNRGATSDGDIEHAVRSFIRQELENKAFHLDEADITITLTRNVAADPRLWSHEDVFTLRLELPYPRITNLFTKYHAISVSRMGTVNVMDYDL